MCFWSLNFHVFRVLASRPSYLFHLLLWRVPQKDQLGSHAVVYYVTLRCWKRGTNLCRNEHYSLLLFLVNLEFGFALVYSLICFVVETKSYDHFCFGNLSKNLCRWHYDTFAWFVVKGGLAKRVSTFCCIPNKLMCCCSVQWTSPFNAN